MIGLLSPWVRRRRAADAISPRRKAFVLFVITAAALAAVAIFAWTMIILYLWMFG
ncbi:MAG TPA: hypothetical protein VFH61_18885 [Thermoleophilia bacterium]|nr:hypothetical protein [Thermoleophilia bacterium]